jgi:uncharacterized protein
LAQGRDIVKTQLTLKEQRQLLAIARDAISATVCKTGPGPDTTAHGNLQNRCGCFVTIKSQGRLRGCIGCFAADTTLPETVRDMAAAAATSDPRFYPVTQEEIPELSIELSILSPLEKINTIEEILPGTHGLYIEKNMFRGVLLPQVAVEYGWDRETFLEQTCLKAGLESDAWKNEADIYIFSALIINEQ